MKKKIILFCICLAISGCGTENSAAARIDTPSAHESQQKQTDSGPLSLWMPSTNYNSRPANTKIDTVVIHHTAPFPSLTSVGYFFQDVNSRVSAHYTVGKEGLIIQSVAEEDRAWHGGLSSWLGKIGLNDYSVGIEVLNDGDSKDPFTEPQYEALAELTAYLIKKYEIPLERVIGHRDIAIPLGRKIDPADNFDWKYFKAKVRNKSDLSPSFFGWGELPQDNLPSENKLRNLLFSKRDNDRAEAVNQILTYPMAELEEDIKKAYYLETNPEIKIRFLNLFNWYENNQYVTSAREILADKNAAAELKAAAIRYLFAYDREFSLPEFQELLKRQDLPQPVRTALVNALSSSKNPASKNILLDMLNKTADSQLKKEIIAALANFNDKTLNPVLLSYLSPETGDGLRAAVIESLRVTFDKTVESSLLELLNKGSYNDEVREAMAWALMRNKSREGMSAMMQPDFYNRLDIMAKTGIINTIAAMKITEAENWLIEQSVQARDASLKAAIFLSLGRLEGEKGFTHLVNNFNYNLSPELNFVLLKALSNYDKPEVNRAIEEILERNIYSAEIKLLAVSTIKDKRLIRFIPHLENALKTADEKGVQEVLKETLKVLRQK